MQLIAPDHLKGRHSNRDGKTPDQVRERDVWIADKLREGHSHREIAEALGIGTQVVSRVRKSAGLQKARPETMTDAARSARDAKPQRGRQTYLAPNGDRINLPCPPGHEGELAPLPREETKPRFSYMVALPDRRSGQSRPQAASIEGVIAAIRQAHAERGHA